MRKFIVSEFLTIDGVMQSPGGPDEDRRGGFQHGGWQRIHADNIEGGIITEGIANSGGFLLGRRTYEIFAAYWSIQPAEDQFAAMINNLPKYVVSETLKAPLKWNNSALIKENVAEELTKLKKQEGKDLLVIGSGDLIESLIEYDLVDEYRLMIHPLVLGSGMRLFKEGIPKISLKLIDSKTSSTGVLILTYRPEGH